SNLTAVPNSAIAAEATETAVLTNTPASANAPIQISMIRPEPEEMYALSDMLAFAWEWPEPLAAGQRFIISIYQEDELKARTAIFTPIANTRYEWEIPITDFAESPGEYQWEMGLELEGIDRNIREVSLTAFTILENTPTPTITNTPSPTATPTNTPTPTNTATPTATATRACVRIRPSGWISYAIQDNDSLSFLATQTGTTVARLQEVNCLSTIALTVGQTLYLPTSPFPSTPTAEPLSTPSDNEPPSNPNPQPTSPPPPPTASGPPTPTAPAIP
ncbi:MAG: LysM peptidoglycan-binding domain-containing protein, partial [Chloroflexi bacterium]|nr:LysM peptidoglycan-binding domain-containing protein [Chloroflexota bacterium]